MKYIALVDGREIEIEINREGHILVDGTPLDVDLQRSGAAQTYSLIIDNKSHEVFVERDAGNYDVMIGGDRFEVAVDDARMAKLKAMGGAAHAEAASSNLTAPMPGLVVKILVEVGAEVEANQPLLILEAMKMENELRSPGAGIVKGFGAVAGQTVNQGDTLIQIEAPEAAE